MINILWKPVWPSRDGDWTKGTITMPTLGVTIHYRTKRGRLTSWRIQDGDDLSDGRSLASVPERWRKVLAAQVAP